MLPSSCACDPVFGDLLARDIKHPRNAKPGQRRKLMENPQPHRGQSDAAADQRFGVLDGIGPECVAGHDADSRTSRPVSVASIRAIALSMNESAWYRRLGGASTPRFAPPEIATAMAVLFSHSFARASCVINIVAFDFIIGSTPCGS
jgi:hypothetical protein